MSLSSDPATMQAEILERLLKRADSKPKLESKAPHKFAKQMGELIETKLRDRLHHEIQAEQVKLSPVRFLQPAIRQQAPVSILWDNTNVPLAILRYDIALPNILSRVCFGGDIESPIAPSTQPTTEAEFGLLQMMAGLISKALVETGLATVAHITTVPENQLETDEYKDDDGYKSTFNIQVGQSSCNIDLTVRQSLIMGTVEVGDTNQLAPLGSSNDDMMQTPVLASVKLKPQPTTLGKIRAMKVGDCLPLASEDQLQGQFFVSGQELFDCQIGRSGEAYSLKISKRANPETTALHALSTTA